VYSATLSKYQSMPPAQQAEAALLFRGYAQLEIGTGDVNSALLILYIFVLGLVLFV
jgi:hypothetical protein